MTKYLRGNFDTDLELGTLAPKDLVKEDFDETVSDTTRVSSIVATYTLSNYTKGFDFGPIVVGVAHSDYTAIEIEEWLEAASGWEIGNLVAHEVTGRRCRQIGVFDNPESAGSSSRLNDGKPIRTKLNWVLAEGQTLSLWAYNNGTLALTTTNPNVNALGHANLWAQ